MDTTDYSGSLTDVFNHFDTEGKGYITVDHFATLAANFIPEGGEFHIKDITTLFDSKGDGKISFEEFCEGVQQIASRFTGLNQNNNQESNNDRYQAISIEDKARAFEIDEEVVFSSPSHDIHVTSTHSRIADDGDSAISDRSVSSSDDRTVESPTEEYGLYDDFSSPSMDVTPSLRKIPSAAQLASRRLNKSGASSSDLAFEQFDENYSELVSTVKKLEVQNHQMSEKQRLNDEKHTRLRDENSDLTRRIHYLEEQLKDVEVKFQDQVEEEKRNYKESMAKFDDRSEEMQILTESYQRLREESEVLKEEAPRQKAEVDRLRKENSRLEHEIQELQEKLRAVTHEKKSLQEKFEEEQSGMSLQTDVHNQLVEELSKEVEELRNYKDKVQSGQSPASHSTAQDTVSALRQLQAQINSLKKENAQCKEQNDDLQAQLLRKQIEEGQNILANGTGMSLAHELDAMPREELQQKLTDQQESNAQMREYMENIMVRIMEKDPTILEISNQSPEKSKKKKK